MPTNYSNQLRMRTVRKPGEGPSDGAQRNSRIAANNSAKRADSKENKERLIASRTADAEKRTKDVMKMSKEETVTEAKHVFHVHLHADDMRLGKMVDDKTVEPIGAKPKGTKIKLTIPAADTRSARDKATRYAARNFGVDAVKSIEYKGLHEETVSEAKMTKKFVFDKPYQPLVKAYSNHDTDHLKDMHKRWSESHQRNMKGSMDTNTSEKLLAVNHVLKSRGEDIKMPEHKNLGMHVHVMQEETINEIFGFGKKSDQKDLPKYPDGNKVKEWMTAKLDHALKHNPKEAHHLFSPASPVYMPKDVHAGSEWKKEHQDHYRELKKKHPDLVQKAKKHMESNGPYIQSRVGDDQDYHGVKLREETNTEKREKIKNVARMDDADPTSEKSTLNKTGSIKTKIVEEKPTMSLPNFGLSASLIAAARQIVEKKDDVKLTGGKTQVEVDPETDDRSESDEDTSTSRKKKKLDPVGKEDDDIDNDGDVDKSDSYLKNRRKAIGKAIKEDEQLDEVSKSTLGSYVKKASDDATKHSYMAAKTGDLDTAAKASKRIRGIAKATDKLTKEDFTADELARIDEIAQSIFEVGTDGINPNGKQKGMGDVTNAVLSDEKKPGMDDDQHKHPMQQLEKIAHSVEGREPHFEHKDGSKTKVGKTLARQLKSVHDSMKTTQEKNKFADSVHANRDSMRAAADKHL